MNYKKYTDVELFSALMEYKAQHNPQDRLEEKAVHELRNRQWRWDHFYLEFGSVLQYFLRLEKQFEISQINALAYTIIRMRAKFWIKELRNLTRDNLKFGLHQFMENLSNRSLLDCLLLEEGTIRLLPCFQEHMSIDEWRQAAHTTLLKRDHAIKPEHYSTELAYLQKQYPNTYMTLQEFPIYAVLFGQPTAPMAIDNEVTIELQTTATSENPIITNDNDTHQLLEQVEQLKHVIASQKEKYGQTMKQLEDIIKKQRADNQDVQRSIKRKTIKDMLTAFSTIFEHIFQDGEYSKADLEFDILDALSDLDIEPLLEETIDEEIDFENNDFNINHDFQILGDDPYNPQDRYLCKELGWTYKGKTIIQAKIAKKENK